MAEEDNDDQPRWAMLDRPYAYVIFPLIVVFIIMFVATILYNRRRRRRHFALHGHNWPGGRQNPHAHIPAAARRRQPRRDDRWGPWGATRSQEGLNEQGEAPPPYDGKREGTVREQELGDLERGEGTRPPEYITEPGPAVVREGGNARYG